MDDEVGRRVRNALWYVALFALGVLPWALLVFAAMSFMTNAEAYAD